MTTDRASMMEQLKGNRARMLADRTKTIKLPGWDSLSVRYKRLPWERVKGLAGMGQGDDAAQDISAAMDVLLAACDEVLFQGEGLGLKFEQGLAELTGDEDAVTPPEVLHSLFPDELSLMTHAGEYMAWAARMESEASERLGKSSGQTGE